MKNLYCAFLRGINVGGHRKIPMAVLREIFEKCEFSDVKTYLQTGNVVFTNHANFKSEEIVKILKDSLQNVHLLNSEIILRDNIEIKGILLNNPFSELGDYDIGKVYITLLNQLEKRNEYNIEGVLNGDSYKIIDNEVWAFCRNGYGNTKLNNNFFEKKLGVIATTRNLKTLKAVEEIMK